MAEHRPFPPSPRRRALARAAGLSAASPLVVGAVAAMAALVALVASGRGLGARLGGSIAAACAGRANLPTAASLTTSVIDLALPALVAAALATTVAHLAQTRTLWLPHRRIPGAPSLTPRRGARAGLELAGAFVVGAVTIGWLWAMAPRIAALPHAPHQSGPVLASFLAAIVIAWIALGAIDALIRHAELTHALRMSASDHREDQRRSGADPRWRGRRAQLARQLLGGAGAGSPRHAVVGSSVVILGDDLAIAVAWDPVRRPVPITTARGRGPGVTQLIGLARRHAIAVHRDPELAGQLASQPHDGPVPERHWPRLAEIIAAVGGRRA